MPGQLAGVALLPHPGTLAILLVLCALAAPVWADQEPDRDAPGVATKATPATKRPALRKKKDLPPEPVPGYSYRVIEGFHVLINKEVLDHEADPKFKRKPLSVLELELKLISGLFPSEAVSLLRTVPIWAEWPKSGSPPYVVAIYHSGPTDRHRRQGAIFRYESLEQQVKSNAIEIVNMEALTTEHQPATDSGRCVLLHELSHAVHHHLFDYDNEHIKSAYQQAIRRGLYANQYASTDEKEYFAELSCAYFDVLAYKPRSRDELKHYDPLGYKMMELTWGTPEQITTARDAEARTIYLKVRRRMRALIHYDKLDEATRLSDEFLSCYRGTKTAELARKEFDEFVEAKR